MTDAHETLGITGDSDADRCRSSEMPSSKATSAASPERPVLNREDAAAQVAAGSGEQRDPCIGNDPACPCQDGDACHYKDTPTTKAWPIPQAEQERPQIEVSLAAGLGYWGIALCVGAQSFALLAEFATLTEADVYAERLRKALGIIGDSDACR